MEHKTEIEIDLRHVSVQLATVNWEGVEETPLYNGYALTQRLSDDHSPLRIGNLAATEVLPHVRSVGFLPPGRSVQLFPIGRPLRVVHCVFEEEFFQTTTDTTRDQWEEHLGSLVSIRSKRLEILMQEIYAELLEPDFGQELSIEAASTMILVELARTARHLDIENSQRSARFALPPWRLRRIQDRIDASPELGYPTLAELAEICGISEGHLARTFKVATGWQIHKYIAEERLKAAKDMLANGQLSCAEVSERLGFKSPAYFSTAFRRMTGKTPSEYRSEMRAKLVSMF